MSPPGPFFALDVDGRRSVLDRIADAGLDGVVYADHVSFRGGAGTDGLAFMAAVSQLHPTLGLHLGVYLLPLRHPVPVARQIATIAELAPGRLRFGVGIGGEDRHEIEACGVDPRTRGRRCDEALTVLRPLLCGERVTFAGEFFDLADVRILPAPDPAVPIVVGGRSDAAVRRAGRFGDGWLGAWCSSRRFADAVAHCAEVAEASGRGRVDWQHGMQLWVGIDADRSRARAHVQAGMEAFYRLPFDVFERYTPYGTPAEVAEFFVPFLDAGLRRLDITPCAASDGAAIEGAAEVKLLLDAHLAR